MIIRDWESLLPGNTPRPGENWLETSFKPDSLDCELRRISGRRFSPPKINWVEGVAHPRRPSGSQSGRSVEKARWKFSRPDWLPLSLRGWCFICERVSQNRYQFWGEKNWTHVIEAKCASQPKMALKPWNRMTYRTLLAGSPAGLD